MAPDTPLVTGVDFAVVPTEDFDSAVEFYGEVLSLPCSARYGRMPGAEFETGTLTLAVLEAKAFGLEFNPNTNGIALRVDDVQAARAELESRGVRVPWRHRRQRGLPLGPTSPTGTGTRSSSTTDTRRATKGRSRPAGWDRPRPAPRGQRRPRPAAGVAGLRGRGRPRPRGAQAPAPRG
jgi:catechol 2,3-dioxygenase-like lactoylglutathione lyase family enzyme